ncbi:MAG: tRNA (guanine(10)-N(2))-dimethyltransferase [Candidatus Altiarchaeota archaeon]|nr:tRNA (guanine(10)-N(2))-dimethyltransferase [Candidatus Altiarchaeota archaeon]
MVFFEVVEGSTRLLVPREDKLSKKNPVFYNPVMELNRDLSVVLCRILEPKSFCDLLAGSGARGVRVAKEAGVEVTLNDMNPRAVELIKKNASLNKVKVSVESMDALALLGGGRFDFIDVDPFGPPVRFVESALQALTGRGFLGVCATDTSALCGSYPRACVRKYDALSLRTDFYSEAGLRILLGFIARSALRNELGVRFLFSHSTMHYMRTYLQVDTRNSAVRETGKKVSFMQYCRKCLDRRYRSLNELEAECSCGGELSTFGPLWNGVYADKELCGMMKETLGSGEFNSKAQSARLIETVSAEQDETTPFFDMHKLCSKLGKPVPKMDSLQRTLESRGFKFRRTHFSDVGFRTDAEAKEVNCILSSL